MSWGMDEDELEEEDDGQEMSVEEAMVADGDSDTTEDTSDDDGWGADVSDISEDDDNDEETLEVTRDDLEFPERFAMAVAEGDVEDEVTVSTLEDKYKELDEASIIQDAMEQDTRSSAQEVYERRLRQVTDEGNDSDDSSQNEEDETQDETSDDESSGWGVDDDEATQDDVDEAVEEVDPDELDEIGVDNLADEDTSETSDDTEDAETTEVSSVDDDVSGIGDVDIGDVAPNAMSTDEAADQPYLWRILGWAPPGRGKTHFGFTMPQPVCIIDTEGKAHNLASKFEDKVTYIWQPDNYDEARDALDEAISVLHRYLEEGHRGTIVVDSMSEMWEWSKQKYVSKAYQGKTLDEVNLSSNMGRSGESDWKVIKRYHNKRFREVMIDTPFHLYWSAMQTDDYEAIMEGEEGNPKKPVGERDNPYKVDQVLRFIEGPDGEPVGQLQKNGLSKYSYTGLRYPTFPKHKQVCEEIRDLEEEGKDPMLEDVFGGDVRVVEGNPGRWSSDD